MAHTVKRRAYEDAATINATTIEAREIVVDTDANELVLGDGSTVGGIRMQKRSAALDAIRAAGAVVADRLFYWTSATAGAFATLTSFARTLLDDADADAARTTLGVNMPGYLAGQFYCLSPHFQTTATAYAPTVDTTITLVPFIIRRPVTLASLNIRTVTGAGSSAAKLGIWAADSSTGSPTGTAITNAVSNTGQATTGNNTTQTISASATLQPGLYWYGVAVTTAAPTFRSLAQNDMTVESLHGKVSLTNNFGITGYTAPYTYSNDITALDLTAATLTDLHANSGVPVMWMVPA